MNNYLDKSGLTHLWSKIKDKFIAKDSLRTINGQSLIGNSNIIINELESVYEDDLDKVDDAGFYVISGGGYASILMVAHDSGGWRLSRIYDFGDIYLRTRGEHDSEWGEWMRRRSSEVIQIIPTEVGSSVEFDGFSAKDIKALLSEEDTVLVFTLIGENLNFYPVSVDFSSSPSTIVLQSLSVVNEGKQGVFVLPLTWTWDEESGTHDFIYNGVQFIPLDLSMAAQDDNHMTVSLELMLTWNGKQDALVSGTNIKTINNVSLLGSGNINIESGSNVKADWNATSGESLILNKPTLAKVATSGSYNDLTNKPTIPTKTSNLTNDSNFVTDASYVHTDNNFTNALKTKLDNIESGAQVNVKPNWNAQSGSSAEILNKPTLASVATSGSYNDLTNKPTIPSISGLATETYVDNAVSNLVNSAPATLDTLSELATALGNDANFATTVSNQIGSKYTKPETGIPSTDLSSAVQSSLALADSAVQTELDPVFSASVASTITSADISNWNSKAAGGVEIISSSVSGNNSSLDDNPYSQIQTAFNAGKEVILRVVMNPLTASVDIPLYASNNTFVGKTVYNMGDSWYIDVTVSSTNTYIRYPMIQDKRLPSVTSSDNGKVLKVVNGVWSAVTPTTIYTGTATPSNSVGNDGDIYIQMS